LSLYYTTIRKQAILMFTNYCCWQWCTHSCFIWSLCEREL